MGKDLTEPVFVEFFGLPASGKTTLSHIVADKLRLRGYEVSEPNYDIVHGHNGIGRVMRKLFQLLRFWVECPTTYNQIKRIVYNNSYHGISAKKHLINLILKVRAYQDFSGGIMVWDQGIYQAIISLSITGEQNCEINKDLFFQNGIINKRILKIYLDTPVDVAMQRMANRHDGKSRIDKITKLDDRRQAMEVFHNCCLSLFDDKQISVDGMLSLEEQSEIVMERLFKYI